MAHLVKNLPAVQKTVCNAKDPCSIPGLERSPGKENGNLLQYSCLGNLNRGALRAVVHGVGKVGHDLATNDHNDVEIEPNITSLMELDANTAFNAINMCVLKSERECVCESVYVCVCEGTYVSVPSISILSMKLRS